MPADNDELVIRAATAQDADAAWNIFQAVVATGDSYAFTSDTTRDHFLQLWMQPPVKAFVALLGGRVAGSYMLKPVQPGRGAHIANAAYMTAPEFRGRGIGEALGRHSLVQALALGYRGMQFNFVISTNTAAVRLWQKLGFEIIGTIPGAFAHAALGDVDVHVMYRTLGNA